ncbi:MAG TPA: hypothetical protein VFJ82_22600 [Longimicrobium sp.]|nr:hypothetical protein [Longimicrobium sp.]
MRTLLVLFAAATVALPAAAQRAQTKTADQGREGVLDFHPDAPFVKAVVPNAMAQVWTALPDAYKLLGFTAHASRDTTRKDVSTESMAIRGQLYPGEANSLYFDCGRNSLAGPLADQGDITFSMSSHVEPDPAGGTAVLTQVNARVKRRDSSQYPVDCISTGRLEQTMAQFLRQRLQTQGAIEIRRNP